MFEEKNQGLLLPKRLITFDARGWEIDDLRLIKVLRGNSSLRQINKILTRLDAENDLTWCCKHFSVESSY